jgi:hypothetical protein
MGWSVTTNNNKYQIKYGSNINYAIVDDDESYFTITDTKHIGINNVEPDIRYLLDINGETRITSNMHIVGNLDVSDTSSTSNLIADKILTSNIIGASSFINSNILKINYTSPTNYSNNDLVIYGKTSNFGKVYINESLNVKTSITTESIYAGGGNIININANNISTGILKTQYGGTGLSAISRTHILFGGPNNSITHNDLFKFEDNTLYAPNFQGFFNVGNADKGVLLVSRGGTGITTIDTGSIPFGKSSVEMKTSPLLSYNDDANTLILKTLNVSNILITGWETDSRISIDRNGVIEPLNFRDVGLLDATYTVKGIVMPDIDHFQVVNGKISLRASPNTWTANTAGNKIIFPSETAIDAAVGTVFAVGINLKFPQYTLDVNGDINTSNNGTVRIGGQNILTIIENEVSAAVGDYLSEGKTTNMKIVEESIGNNETWKVFTDLDKVVTFKTTNLIATANVTANKIIITTNDAITPNDNLTNLVIIKDNDTAKFKFSKAGRLVIGPNIDDIEPSQSLDIRGNIHASGYIRSAFSDKRLKTVTSNITNALDIIDSLQGFRYVPNEKAIQLGFDYDNEIGLCAQDVQKVIPEIVKLAPFDTYRKDGNIASKSGEEYLTICYERLSAVFVEAIKELRAENTELKTELKLLKKEIDDIKKIIYIN